MTQFKKTLVRLRIFLLTASLFSVTSLLLSSKGMAQSSYLPQGSKFEHFLDRMEILQQTDPELNIRTDKPISRRAAVRVAELADSLHKFYPYDEFYHLSKVDQQNLFSLMMNNEEWVQGSRDSFASKHPVWNTFYKTRANFYEVNEKDFFLAGNPSIEQTQSVETSNNARVFLNSKGLNLRGVIGGVNGLGFSAYLTDNQERGPKFFMARVDSFNAVPGAGYYKPFKQTAVDYIDNRASIYFRAWKYFDFQFGYDKNFIGSGYRSLFLSDFSAPYTFLKFTTRIWKLNYENLYMELVAQHKLGDYQYPKKYSVIHHLSVNVTPWLNLGLFENVTYSRADHFDFSYLNPVIFLVAAQQENGSPDKTTVGFDYKANIGHAVQIYGQILINEFVLDQVLHYSRGWWGNKQGLQFGMKYIDAFTIKNLDLQLETNVVRPYTYQHDDTVANYTHYNQPLAHPLGANFAEFIAIAHYQPSYKWRFEGKIIYYKQGLDSAGVNFGANPFEQYTTRPRDYGINLFGGVPATCVNMSGLVSYEWKENLNLEASAMYRSFQVNDPSNNYHSSHSALFTLGVRINIFRRQYDY